MPNPNWIWKICWSNQDEDSSMTMFVSKLLFLISYTKLTNISYIWMEAIDTHFWSKIMPDKGVNNGKFKLMVFNC